MNTKIRILMISLMVVVFALLIGLGILKRENYDLKEQLVEKNEQISTLEVEKSNQEKKIADLESKNSNLEIGNSSLQQELATTEEAKDLVEKTLDQQLKRKFLLVNTNKKKDGSPILGTQVDEPFDGYVRTSKKLAKKYPIRLSYEKKKYKGKVYWKLTSSIFTEEVKWTLLKGKYQKIKVEKNTIFLPLKDKGTYILKFQIGEETAYIAVKW